MGGRRGYLLQDWRLYCLVVIEEYSGVIVVIEECWSHVEGLCEEYGDGKEVWGEGVGGCAEGEKVGVVRACGEKGGYSDLGKNSACCGTGVAATWKT